MPHPLASRPDPFAPTWTELAARSLRRGWSARHLAGPLLLALVVELLLWELGAPVLVAVLVAAASGIAVNRAFTTEGRTEVRDTRRLFHRARRDWVFVSRALGLVGADRVATAQVVRAERTSAGFALELLLPVGLAPSKVAASAELIASALGVLSVLVEPSTLAANRLRLVAQATDPLAQPITDPWPWLDAQSVSFFGSPIPAGVDEAGQLVTVAMAENNLLIAGEPGGGKSATLAQFVAAAALDPRVRLYLLDGKVVELGIFRAAADGFADNLPAATRLLVDVRAEMQKRYELLSYTRARKSDLAAVDFEPLVVVVDELAFFTSGASADKKAAGEFESLLRDLVARGRAAGVVVFLCTQRPSADIISTSLRDLVRTRVALRCTTPQASDTVLGSGMASRGFSAQSIAQGQPGTFLLFDEGAAAPRRVRSFFLTDAQLLDIADRAALARMAYHLERPNPTDLAAE